MGGVGDFGEYEHPPGGGEGGRAGEGGEGDDGTKLQKAKNSLDILGCFSFS